jgi:hypothetical protein
MVPVMLLERVVAYLLMHGGLVEVVFHMVAVGRV